MNKKELLLRLSEATGSSSAEANKHLNALVEIIVSATADDEKVRIAGLGTFEAVSRKARNGVNPSTGKPMKIKAKNAPKFKAAKAFKEAVA